MYIPDGGDGPLCGDCLRLCVEGVPVEELLWRHIPVLRDETDSSGPPSLVDSSSDEDVRPQEADSDTQSESSQEEAWQWLLREMGKGKVEGGAQGFPGSKGK